MTIKTAVHAQIASKLNLAADSLDYSSVNLKINPTSIRYSEVAIDISGYVLDDRGAKHEVSYRLDDIDSLIEEALTAAIK